MGNWYGRQAKFVWEIVMGVKPNHHSSVWEIGGYGRQVDVADRLAELAELAGGGAVGPGADDGEGRF